MEDGEILYVVDSNDILYVLANESLGIQEIARRLDTALEVKVPLEELARLLEMMTGLGVIKQATALRGVSVWYKPPVEV